MILLDFGVHESLKIYHWFRHLSFRQTSQLIVKFIRPFINFNKALSFLIQLLEPKERPWIVPLKISRALYRYDRAISPKSWKWNFEWSDRFLKRRSQPFGLARTALHCQSLNQIISLGIAFLLAAALNVDTLVIAQTLWKTNLAQSDYWFSRRCSIARCTFLVRCAQ